MAAQEAETFRTYFAYRDYSNVYRFFDSRRYQRLERRYRHQANLDVARCFESIYTHSLAWALYGKAAVKDHLRERGKKTFADSFDRLQQRLNYNETKGILVGSEVSRIFAEMILQAIDKAVEASLRLAGLHRGVHYEILRYVDDYFVFYDRPEDETTIADILRAALDGYGMALNEAKHTTVATPSITPTSVAKSRIRDLLEEHVAPAEPAGSKPRRLTRDNSARALINAYKTVVRESGAREADLLNSTLALVERRLVDGLVGLDRSGQTEEERAGLVASLVGIVEFCFFIYTSSPRVPPTVKLCRIVDHVTQFTQNAGFELGGRLSVLDVIDREIGAELDRAHSSGHLQAEKLYLMSCLPPLGREYLMSEERLRDLFGAKIDGNITVLPNDIDHFRLVALLHYAQDRHRYQAIREAAERAWIARLSQLRPTHAEWSFLVLDGVSCPYLSGATRTSVFDAAAVPLDARLRARIEATAKNWFVRWRGFNLSRELDLKRNQEVY